MSHFTVMVKIKPQKLEECGDIREAVAQMMAPYQENNMGDCPEEFLKFNDVEEEYREEWNKNEQTVRLWRPQNRLMISKETYEQLKETGEVRLEKYEVDNPFVSLKAGDRNVFYTKPDKGDPEYLYFQIKDVIAVDGMPVKYNFTATLIDSPEEIKVQDYYKSFEDFMDRYAGFSGKDEKTGKYGYWENPNAKWDWYRIGGRWSGLLRIKEMAKSAVNGQPSWLLENHKNDPHTSDGAQIKDIDFEGMDLEIDRRINEFYKKVEKVRTILSGKIKTNKDHWLVYDIGRRLKRMELAKRGENDELVIDGFTKEDLLKNYRWEFEFSTWAVLDEDGWHEKGKMGWWGFSSATSDDHTKWCKSFVERFLKAESPETYIVIVDCHI